MIKLNEDGVKLLEEIVAGLKTKGASDRCVVWDEYAINDVKSCAICRLLFNRSKFSRKNKCKDLRVDNCPCLINKPKALIRKLEYIIEYNERR